MTHREHEEFRKAGTPAHHIPVSRPSSVEVDDFALEDDYVGVDAATTGLAVSAVSELLSKGIGAYSDSQKEDAAKAATAASAKDTETKAAAIIALDTNVTNACAEAEYAVKHSPAADANAKKSVADNAIMMQNMGSSGITPEVTAKRVAAAQAALKNFVDQQAKNPKSELLGLKVKYAQQTMMKAQQGGMAMMPQMPGMPPGGLPQQTPPAPPPPPPEPSFFVKVHAGLPTYAWCGIGAVVLGTGGFFLVRWLKGRGK